MSDVIDPVEHAHAHAEELLNSLTDAQLAVLDRVVMHKTSKEIARELDISPNTVDQRVKAVRQKLGVEDRAELARVYSKLNRICGRTICGQPVIDFTDLQPPDDLQTLPTSPVFTLHDAYPARDWDFHREPLAGLEAFDARFGRIGRIGGVIVLSLVLSITLLAGLAIARALGDLI